MLYLGAADYICKPFSVTELSLRVHNRLDAKERLGAYYASLLQKDSDKEVLLEEEEFQKEILAALESGDKLYT